RLERDIEPFRAPSIEELLEVLQPDDALRLARVAPVVVACDEVAGCVPASRIRPRYQIDLALHDGGVLRVVRGVDAKALGVDDVTEEEHCHGSITCECPRPVLD